MSRRIASVLAALTLAAGIPAPARATHPELYCSDTRASNRAPATGVADDAGDIRVYAIQYKQEVRSVESYETFRHKIDCLVRDFVRFPRDRYGHLLPPETPTIVAFNEDIGLATLATGTRGAAARAFATYGPKDPQSIPGAIGSFATLAASYQPAVAWYASKEPETNPQRLILAAATDTFARGFMRTFSDLARTYGVYVVASNNQAEFSETSDPAAVAALHDPDLSAEYASGRLRTVYEAVDDDARPESVGVGRGGIDVYNQAWMWAPTPGTTDYARARFERFNGGPLSAGDPRANVVAVTRKTPLTSIEQQVLDLSDDFDLSPANTGPFCLASVDDPGCRARIGFGISLPAFQWGSAFGVPFGGDPCAKPATWMRCLDARGVTLFLQPEANSGMWAEYIDCGWKPCAFQSLSWLDSAWRAVADPTVRNIRYAITPFMVGNLVDLTFDGQSSIFERCVARDDGADTCDGNVPRTHAGASYFEDCGARTERCDDPALKPYSGHKSETIAMVPWVIDECPPCLGPIADRERLAARSRAMQAGTGSPVENDYLETAIWADLDFD